MLEVGEFAEFFGLREGGFGFGFGFGVGEFGCGPERE